MRKSRMKFIALSLLSAITITGIIPSVAMAEELQVSEETKQEITTSVEEVTNELLDNATEVTSDVTEDVGEVVENVTTEPAKEVAEKEVAVTDSVEQLNEVVPNEELVSSTSTSLIINSTDDMTFSDETIVSAVKYDEYYVVTYDTADNAKIAFDAFTSQGIAVEYNNSIDKPEDVNKSELDKVENTSDEVESTEADTEKKTITVAVLDTGIADISDDELLKDMVLEGYSVIDDSVYDNNGHGTVMANIIASSFRDTEMYSDTEIKILPIKVLDENGNGSVLSVYMGMEYALSHNADVINLSISGLGNSNILTNEINKAYNQGVTTVVAAGNNSDDVANYIPGNIDTAITVSAVADRDSEKVFAEYSNHGSFVDFSAMGTYEMTYTDEAGEEIITSVNGTSVASAYVTSYVAMLKALGREDVSETDVYASLQASVDDLGEVGFDEYFGFGYLAKNNIKEIKEHTADKEKDVDLEENEEDGVQEVNTSGGWYGDYWMATSEADLFIGVLNGATKFLLMNDITYVNTWGVNGGNYLLDLGGHTIYTDPQKLYAFALNEFMAVNSGTITLQNGTIDGRGLCYSGSGTGNNEVGALITVYPTGTLVMNNINIGNVTNKVDYNASADEGGGTIVNNWGTLVANNTCFHDCSGTAIWLQDTYNSAYGNGTGTTLNNCSSYNVSGLYSTGSSRGINTGLVIDGGNYRCGRQGHYLAGIEAFNTTSVTIRNCSIAGHVTISDHSFINMDNVHMDENNKTATDFALWCFVTLKSDRNSTISNCTFRHGIFGILCEENQNVTNTINNVSISENALIGIELRGGNINLLNSNINNTVDGLKNEGGNFYIYNTTSIHNCSDKGIFNESGTVTIDRNAATNIYKNQTGILNQGTCTINSGTISNNRQDGVKNGDKYSNAKGTLIINGGLIENNGRNGIYNEHGKAQINGGTNRGNKQYGYRNESELVYASGVCGDNSFYDIYQNGDYKMSGNARAYSNGVYLTPGHTINITSPLTCEDGAIKVTIKNVDAHLGRNVAYCSYGMNKDNADAMLNKFVLTNKNTTSGTNHKAALRSGNGINGAVGNIILSEEYYVSFDKNINNSKVTADVPRVQTHYWKEDAWVPCGEVNLYYNGKKFNSLVHNGWNKSASFNSDGCGVNGWLVYPAEEMTSDKVVYAIYTGGLIDLSINGNNQTAGDNYTLYNFENNNSLLPENTFERKYEEMVYDVNLEHDELSRRIYSHEGWHLSDSATYKDNPYGYNQNVDFTGLIYDQLNSDTVLVGDDGNVNITIYSVWDEPPVITAKNWWISTKQVDDGIFTDENILKRVNATDKEDGTNLKLEVVYPVSKDYYYTLGRTGVWKKGKATVTIVATDSRGNETRKLMYVGVHKDGMIESSWADESKGELPRYVRSISRKFYDMKDTDAGLGKYSVWYVVPTYKKTILDAFYRLENDQPIMIYEFNCADIRSSQEHCFSAIRNETWLTKEHYDECVEMYKDNKIYDSGYRSSQALCSNRNMNWYKDKEIPEEWFDYSNGITDANLQGWVGYYKAINPSFSELQYIEE